MDRRQWLCPSILQCCKLNAILKRNENSKMWINQRRSGSSSPSPSFATHQSLLRIHYYYYYKCHNASVRSGTHCNMHCNNNFFFVSWRYDRYMTSSACPSPFMRCLMQQQSTMPYTCACMFSSTVCTIPPHIACNARKPDCFFFSLQLNVLRSTKMCRFTVNSTEMQKIDTYTHASLLVSHTLKYAKHKK